MLSTIWNTVLFYPFLNLMIILYNFLGENLGFAILGIAVIARILMIPLVKRQTEMTKKMASLKPQMDELQKKYANNKEKLSQEQVKLYKKVGYNPLGCIGTFIPQLIILSVLIAVIRAVTSSSLDGLYPWVKELTGIVEGASINTKFLFWELTSSYKEVAAEFGNFSMKSLPYIGLSLLVGVTQYFTSVFTQKMQNLSAPAKKVEKGGSQTEELQAKMQKSTILLLPLMTVFFTISMPAALGWYWMIQSLLLVVQYLSLDFDKAKKGVQNLWDILVKKNEK